VIKPRGATLYVRKENALETAIFSSES